MKIKLIATDIDGTLLPEGTDRVNPELFSVIRELKERGAVFAAASGRQYHSMARLFEPVKRDMIFIAENGAYVNCRGVDTVERVMDWEQVKTLIGELRRVPKGCVTVDFKDGFYVEHKDPKFLNLILNGYHNIVYQVDDVLAQEVRVIKVSLYLEHGIDEAARTLVSRWRDRFTCTIAGDIWLDFMCPGANKGSALGSIQQTLAISQEETMAFGDNLNDIAMLDRAAESYAVGNARDEVKAAAKYVADSNVNDGVLKVLKKLLADDGQQRAEDGEGA